MANDINFKNDIAPIFESNCYRCHNGEVAEGGYRIDLRDKAMDYIEAGDAEASDLFLYLISDDEDELMPPPDDGGPMDDSDIQLIKTWINEGAEWPSEFNLSDPDREIQEDIDTAETSSDSDDPTAAEKQKPPATKTEKKSSLFKAIGVLHPATLHLPMGLLLAAGFFALLSLRGNFVMSDCAYYCLWLGTFGAILACVTGWYFVMTEYPTEYVTDFEGLQNMDHKVFWHRASALGATLFALLLALFAASARNRDPEEGVAWKFGTILLALAIGFVGHQGGKLTWKASHYDELFDVIEDYAPGLIGEEEADENPLEPTASADSEKENPESGVTEADAVT
ncbi:MAG: c-type cytochrome domain-containing protein [Planctomycetota bacterium]